MKKILLTGGSGFIGRNLRESFLASKYDISAPAHSELDLLDTRSTDEFFKKNSFDFIIHAAVKPCHRNAKDPTALLYSNLRMFENLERNKGSFGKLVNIGSGAIYGQSADISAARETDVFKRMPEDDHGFCKYAVAKQIEHLTNFIDLAVFGIFGKYEDYSIRFISNAICKAVFGLPITLRQNRRFSYLFVDDLFPIIDAVLSGDCKHKMYNAVPNGYAELAGIARLVSEMFGGVPVKIAADGYGPDYYGDNSRLLSEFPEIKFTPLETAVGKLAKYYRDNSDKIDQSLLKFDK